MKSKAAAILVIILIIIGFTAPGRDNFLPGVSTAATAEPVADTTSEGAAGESDGVIYSNKAVTLDKRILIIETNIAAIMERGTHEFFGYHPVTEEFFFYLVKNYGEDVIKQVVENRDYSDPEVWFRITGKSIHVLYQEYAAFVGLDAWDYSHVHKLDREDGGVVFLFAGDVAIHEGAATTNYMDQNGIEDCFSGDLLSEMRGADVFVVNNEFCYSSRGEPLPGKTFTFRADPKRVSAMKDMGVDLLCLANNHVFDYGEEALLDTLDTIREAELPYIGAGKNLSEAGRIQYFIAGGRKVAIVNATQIERSVSFTREATEELSGVFKTLDPTNCVRAIERAKRNADYCFVVVHWGTEGSEYYGYDQVQLAEAYAAAGADAIIGGHTHCLEGIEYIGETIVYYSLGNFWFSTSANMPPDYDTGLAAITIGADGKLSPAFIPARFSGGVTRKLSGDEASGIYTHLESISQTTSIGPDGKIGWR